MGQQSYPYPTTQLSRHITTSRTCSTSGSSADPDEDWTKISDHAERRRIQNRIAQRKYRKKLKRRLEELERHCGCPSNSHSQTPAEIIQLPQPGESRQHDRSPEIRQPQPSLIFLPNQFTPPMQDEDEGIFAHGFEQDGSRTAPIFVYPTCPAPEKIIYSPYPQPYKSISISGDWTDYLNPALVTLPHDSLKRKYEDRSIRPTRDCRRSTS